jgi:hypothetical protein
MSNSEDVARMTNCDKRLPLDTGIAPMSPEQHCSTSSRIATIFIF